MEEKIFEGKLGNKNIDRKLPVLLNTVNLQTNNSNKS